MGGTEKLIGYGVIRRVLAAEPRYVVYYTSR